MAISKINISDIEWITNGERASSINLNRALKQFITKYNASIDEINSAMGLSATFSLDSGNSNIEISTGKGNIVESDLGKYVLRSNSISVPNSLSIGWYCYVVSENGNITINLGTDKLMSGKNSFVVGSGELVKLIKLTESKWIIA